MSDLTNDQLAIKALQGQVQFLQAQAELHMREITRLREELAKSKEVV